MPGESARRTSSSRAIEGNAKISRLVRFRHRSKRTTQLVFESGTNPQSRHLLHQMVKEVRVHGRTSVEITYFVPQPDPGRSPVRTQPHLGPQVAQCTNRPWGPKVAAFRIFHLMRPECARIEALPPHRPLRPTRVDSVARAAAWRAELTGGAVPSWGGPRSQRRIVPRVHHSGYCSPRSPHGKTARDELSGADRRDPISGNGASRKPGAVQAVTSHAPRTSRRRSR